MSFFVLYLLQGLQNRVDARFQHRDYKIGVLPAFNISALHAFVESEKLKTWQVKQTRQGDKVTLWLSIRGSEPNLEAFNQWLMQNQQVDAFIW